MNPPSPKLTPVPLDLKNRPDPEAFKTAHEIVPYGEDSPDQAPPRGRGYPLLRNLAVDALRAASTTETPPSLAASVPNATSDNSIMNTQLSVRDKPTIGDMSAPRYMWDNRVKASGDCSGELLPPLRHTVRATADASANTLPLERLPSINHIFGPDQLFRRRPSEQHPSSRPALDGYRTLSPRASPPSYPVNTSYPSDSTEDTSSNAGETPNTKYSISTPEGPASTSSSSIADHVSINEVTNPEHTPVSYRCTYSGCNVRPFAKPFLLYSHMLTHSSERLYYCPKEGCKSGKGGKGFKRNNELKRHLQGHTSPRYICPFCPSERAKRGYPRMDNFQRHVDGQHPAEDKNDPRLRDALARGQEQNERGRRRRGRDV